MKRRYWTISGLAALAILATVGIRSTASNLCSKPKTMAELDRVFTNKLSRLGGKLLDDFSVHGKRGNDVVCSVSFWLKPTNGNPEEAVGAPPTTAAERETYVWAMALLPNLMATPLGQPLVQRVTYQVAETSSGGPVLTIVDFPGMRNLRQ